MYGIIAELSRNVKGSSHDCYHSACSLITTIVNWSALAILHQFRLGHYPWHHYCCMTTQLPVLQSLAELTKWLVEQGHLPLSVLHIDPGALTVDWLHAILINAGLLR